MTGPTLRQRWRDAIRDCTDPRLDAYARLVAVVGLDRFMNADGQAWPGARRLAQTCTVSTDTVAGRLELLVELGWLRVSWEGNGHAAVYTATIPDRPTTSDAHRPTGSDGADGEPSDHSGATVRPQRKSVRHGRTEPGEPGSSTRGEGMAHARGNGQAPAAPGPAPPEEEAITDRLRRLVRLEPDDADDALDDLPEPVRLAALAAVEADRTDTAGRTRRFRFASHLRAALADAAVELERVAAHPVLSNAAPVQHLPASAPPARCPLKNTRGHYADGRLIYVTDDGAYPCPGCHPRPLALAGYPPAITAVAYERLPDERLVELEEDPG